MQSNHLKKNVKDDKMTKSSVNIKARYQNHKQKKAVQSFQDFSKSKKIHKNKEKKIKQFEDLEEQNFDQNNLEYEEDKQYDQLLNKEIKGFNRKKNQYFLENEKYKGRKISHDSMENQEFDDEQNMMVENDDEADQQQQANQNQIKVALKQLQIRRNQVTKSKLLTQSLQEIERQDLQKFRQIKKQKTSIQSYEESVQLKQQLGLYNKLVGIRYGMKEEIQKIKAFPKKLSCPNSHQLYNHNSELQGELIENIESLLNLYKNVASKSFDNFQTEDQLEQLTEKIDQQIQNTDHAQNTTLDCGKIYQFLKQKIAPINQEVQKQLIKWSQKTSILSTTSSSQYNSLLMQTPIGQTKKIISNWERIASKCQQKRGAFKILFQNDDTIHSMSDPQIFDDYDLFMEIQKHYLDKMQNEDQQDFLMNDTLKYLKNRESNPLMKKQKKDVDRKASKNRKIRFNVHPKLLNFMPCGLDNCIQTRDEIVKNMFNCNSLQLQKHDYKKSKEEIQYIDI